MYILASHTRPSGSIPWGVGCAVETQEGRGARSSHSRKFQKLLAPASPAGRSAIRLHHLRHLHSALQHPPPLAPPSLPTATDLEVDGHGRPLLLLLHLAVELVPLHHPRDLLAALGHARAQLVESSLEILRHHGPQHAELGVGSLRALALARTTQAAEGADLRTFAGEAELDRSEELGLGLALLIGPHLFVRRVPCVPEPVVQLPLLFFDHDIHGLLKIDPLPPRLLEPPLPLYHQRGLELALSCYERLAHARRTRQDDMFARGRRKLDN
mmetsp:Transcript_11402/g.26386  ORF Transcript_11402/g.26386 Transcript_11402/m.26386 type:complete len:270 (-) Transcript_11402:533-1342(-)